MPVLTIVSVPTVAFRCGIEGWFESAEDRYEWQYLLSHMVQYAFISRSATPITLSPKQWSIGYSLPNPRLLRTTQTEYLLNQIQHCSAEVLVEIADSEDFQRGLLWLSDLGVGDEEELLATISQMDVTSTDPSVSNHEFLLLLDDARRILWLHPGRDAKTLEIDVSSVARAFGWQVSAER